MSAALKGKDPADMSAIELQALYYRIRDERNVLLAALKELTELGEHVPVFQLDGGKSSVKAVRLAGKFTGAMDKARAAIAKATTG